MKQMNLEEAEKIALAGFQRLAKNEDLLLRFCNLTGILSNQMREAARQPNFYSAVLEFYTAHEPDLIAWAEEDRLNPEKILAAQQVLEPAGRWEFE